MFSSNPLSLSVPEPAFESWLRDTGYLEILDDRANAAEETPTAIPTPPSTSAANVRSLPPITAGGTDRRGQGGASAIVPLFNHLRRHGSSIFSAVRTALSILTVNPVAKLTAGDFCGATPRWTVGFISAAAGHPSYSWPAGPAQARMRVQENVKRYASNYAFLTLLALASSLYQMPKSLFGVVTCIVLWEGFLFCIRRWGLEQSHPVLKNVLLYFTQMATAVVLYYCNIQKAVIVALSISYAVMIIHASLRKLSPSRQSVGVNQYQKFQQKRIRN